MLIAGAILTCGFDVLENVLTLRLIPADGTEATSSSALDALPTVSYAKWTASALTVGLVTLLFIGRSRARIVALATALVKSRTLVLRLPEQMLARAGSVPRGRVWV